MSDSSLEQRVDELTDRVEAVEDTLDRYRKQHTLLLTKVDIEALDDPSCPECGTGTLTKQSGLSWAKAICQNCGTEWILNR